MDIWNPEQTILSNETERKPNRHAANAILAVTVVLLLAWILNELDVFHVNLLLMRVGLLIAAVVSAVPMVFSRHPKLAVWSGAKYIIIACSIIYTFLIMLLLTFHVTMTLIFPILLAMLYRSRRVGWIAVAGSSVCTVFPPVIGYLAGTWDVPFVTLLAELGNRANVQFDASAYQTSVGQGVWYVLLYISLPRLFIVLGCALVMFFVVKTGIESVRDQISIHNFSERDTLTGLYNPNLYKTLLESDLGEGSVGVLFFDVNGLKGENDSMGHEYGDLLLRRCAESIRRILDSDTVGYRIGGDEFLALIRTDDETAVSRKIEAWRAALNDVNLENERQYQGLQCSMEVGSAFGRIADLSELVREADAVMYENKKNRK